MLALVGELLRNLNLQEQRCRVELVRRTRLLVFSGLLQIRAVAGTIQCHLALIATALRTNAAVDGGAETFFLAKLADRAAQTRFLLCKHYGTGCKMRCVRVAYDS